MLVPTSIFCSALLDGVLKKSKRVKSPYAVWSESLIKLRSANGLLCIKEEKEEMVAVNTHSCKRRNANSCMNRLKKKRV
jgi:hypothetical protein